MHLPEFVLSAGAHRRLGSWKRVCVHGEREIHVSKSNLARLDVLVAQHWVCFIVPLLAVRALEVADLDHPERGSRTALNPREVGSRNIRVIRRASSSRGSSGL